MHTVEEPRPPASSVQCITVIRRRSGKYFLGQAQHFTDCHTPQNCNGLGQILPPPGLSSIPFDAEMLCVWQFMKCRRILDGRANPQTHLQLRSERELEGSKNLILGRQNRSIGNCNPIPPIGTEPSRSPYPSLHPTWPPSHPLLPPPPGT